ncbi:hypothetical protein [Streptomyces montanisoli]|uniref:Uncharacterized protein n=1 Tax=Streptomyces montanisoli TaxID=2798581 RepID=A0A940RUS2_9ACTN|nr:hypothetical protein [Streptomyces montanisoli]MBP0457521.1 hypothetical protein [Streptomyces montanisoli]
MRRAPHEVRAESLLRAARALALAGAAGAALWGGRSRAAATVGGGLLLAGCACAGYGIAVAGLAAAGDTATAAAPHATAGHGAEERARRARGHAGS